MLTKEFADDGDAGGSGRLERLLTSENTARLLAAFAGAEMLADKSEYMPDRTNPLPLIGRLVIGSMTAAAFAAKRRRPVLVPAVIGAAAAVAATFAAYHLRRYAKEEFQVPDRLLGLAEDALVIAATRMVMETVDG
jgi:uncharacterized membrane protein